MHPPLIIVLNLLLLFLFSRPDKSVNVLNTILDKLEYCFFVSYLLLIRSIRSESPFYKKAPPPLPLLEVCVFLLTVVHQYSVVSFSYFPSFVILYGCLLVRNPIPSVPYCYLFLLFVFILWFSYYVSDIFCKF